MSVIVDGSTNSAFTENEMVYLHTCHKGEVKTNFITCCQVQHGTAAGVVNAIQRLAETVMDYNTFLSIAQHIDLNCVTKMQSKRSHWLEKC